MKKRKLASLLSAIVLLGCGLFVGCAAPDTTTGDGAKAAGEPAQQTAKASDILGKDDNATKEPTNDMSNENKNPIVTITMKDGGIIKAELYPDIAPNTVANFVTLIQSGFYDGTIFHRVIPEFMIQGGDPEGKGTGGPGYSIKGEFAANGFTNDLKHTRGVLSMARSQAMDSAGSQFFIMHADAPHLDGIYAAFGMVTEGMDVVDRIATAKTGAQDRPKTDQVMKSVTVETFGREYTVEKVK